MRQLRTIMTATLLFMTCMAIPSRAHDVDEFDARVVTDKWHVSAGGFLVEFKTDAQAGFGSFVGTAVRLEDDLQVEKDEVTARLDAFYRWRPRHTFTFGYFFLERRGSTTLDRRVEFGDRAFDIGGRAKSTFSTKIFGAGYRYSLVNTGRSDAGVMVGLSINDFGLELEGNAVAVGDTSSVSAEFSGATTQLLAPVPSLGIFVDHGLTSRLILRSSATFLDITVGDYSGRVVETRFLLEYFFWNDLGVLLGSSSTDIAIDRRDSRPLKLSYRQSGLTFALSYGGR